jgi:hypothetical protein
MKYRATFLKLLTKSLLILLFLSTASPMTTLFTLSTFLKGKVKERGLSCLIDVLEKVNHMGFTKATDDLEGKIREGVTQSIDITTMLLQFSHLSPQDQEEIVNCHLTMKMALKRCESVYSQNNCEMVTWADIVSQDVGVSKNNATIPYVTRRCPEGMKRQGCCKCFKLCNPRVSSPETVGEKDRHNYCLKPQSYESEILRDVLQYDAKRYQPFGDAFIEKCRPGFTRVGAKLCVGTCPLGWPDLGDRCMKTGDMILMPFVWMVGDDAVASEQ